jgi:hypothetical protein
MIKITQARLNSCENWTIMLLTIHTIKYSLETCENQNLILQRENEVLQFFQNCECTKP